MHTLQELRKLFSKEGYVLKKNAIRKFTIKDIEKAFIQCEITNRDAIRGNWEVSLELANPDSGIQVRSRVLLSCKKS